ncbi:MAG: DUF4342 domain-containing protein [Candidatus Nitrosoglobus sp.]|jgi:hypothetical protein
MEDQSEKNISQDRLEKPREKYEEFLGLIKKLVKRGNLRRLVIYKSNGKVFMEVPLTVGAVVGGIFLLFTPTLLAIGTLIALFKQVRVEIARGNNDE